jgi:hypothetical protein
MDASDPKPFLATSAGARALVCFSDFLAWFVRPLFVCLFVCDLWLGPFGGGEREVPIGP